MQEDKPVAFASKALTDTESRYADIKRKLLAVVYGCEKFHNYLYGRSFTVQSDHKPLESIHLKHLMAAPPRLQRMSKRLQPYDLTINYRQGKNMEVADALSRLSPQEKSQFRTWTFKSTKSVRNSVMTCYNESVWQPMQTQSLRH